VRKTKIIATIGPASRDPKVLEQIFLAGLDCARLNFSHGTLEEHAEVIKNLRQLSQLYRRPLAILQDLGGTKLRLGQIRGNLRLNAGEEVTLVAQARSAKTHHLPFPHPNVIKSLKPGDRVFISDGTICLEVKEALDSMVNTRVINGGIVSSYKGVNLPGVEFDQPILSQEDKAAIDFGVKQGVDWIAVSFVRTAQDIQETKTYVESCGGHIPIMAKIERPKAVENLDSILREADAVMVARGDLGIEIPMAKVTIVQKHIVRKANESARLSVIATQMLRSMLVSPMPTRAEISDITNAVLDGCDAILLSDETAIGLHPIEAMKVADITIQEAEAIYPYYKEFKSYDRTQAIAHAAAGLVQALNSRPMVITNTGRTAYELSRFRPNANIIVFHPAKGLHRMGPHSSGSGPNRERDTQAGSHHHQGGSGFGAGNPQRYCDPGPRLLNGRFRDHQHRPGPGLERLPLCHLIPFSHLLTAQAALYYS